MKKLILIFAAAIGLLVSGCESTSEAPSAAETDYCFGENLYNTLTNATVRPLSRTSESYGTIPINLRGTPEISVDEALRLLYLPSGELEKKRNELIATLGPNSQETLDSLEISAYDENLHFLGGEDGMALWESFALNYIQSPTKGWTTIETLLPESLNNDQITFYAASAAIIDNVGRPFNQAINAYELQEGVNVDEKPSFCRSVAEARLAILGNALTLEAITDIMTGGTMTLLDASSIVASAYSIYIDYEACRHMLGEW